MTTRKRRKNRKRKKIVIVLCLLTAIVFLAGKMVGISNGFHMVSLGTGDCPQSLLDLAEKNPETVSFVKHYGSHENYTDDIDVSSEVTQGEIPMFLQWDERWGYEQYGDNYFALTGCGPTCLSITPSKSTLFIGCYAPHGYE